MPKTRSDGPLDPLVNGASQKKLRKRHEFQRIQSENSDQNVGDLFLA